ncbi:fused diaminohydroxyphosphoribosylaminopyrimidine deaminase;5-amino-6-(5-phosphoribosylamino) uracil reductase [Desulfosarcina cetonica]|uniref:bifunctional diaminohydroxyphosphoribosylaminopyrimidine deaminase/5-amino-6-(5-phosphoribosylamino)uracil reductase RibD n=1 Tax=Desulfosarcina cetonica TaxID=90730 RepID=UPI0006D2504D|nr:bifunctional diaminohydroxyphosphoribosylaminopyrimidine deaminase/5-amino-6-(5-phosphoribosylamino)uracil reductase RibD [Desulfosarcina cetonica]VTR69787.1 fused diaminohydroxyphosphoribosylaminopyrimidine deaminase;5-amino-6-(5-phosphoribosylamino) uracil reductase [Desulfosarcina cetonica]
MNDHDYMQLALELAEKGRGWTSPNPMVGAVVVRDGKIVGRGYHQRVGGPHAEVNAIDDAGDRARGATIYVTLEPCNHFGRTPPCTHKIIAAGIRRVVVAMKDPNPDVQGGGNAYLKSHGIEVITGIGETAARTLNEGFVTWVTTGKPFVIVKCAATMDGRIATRTGDSRWVTGPAARAWVHRLRHAVDGIMVGVETVRKDDPSLTTRLEGEPGSDPTRIILDTHLSMPVTAKMLRQESGAPTWVVCGPEAAADRRAALEAAGARIVVASLKDGRIDLAALMLQLGRMAVTRLLIEGGGTVIGGALAAGVVDKVCFFYAPKILGGDDGVPICRGKGPESMRQSLPVHDVTVSQFEGDILVEGYLKSR